MSPLEHQVWTQGGLSILNEEDWGDWEYWVDAVMTAGPPNEEDM